MDCRDVRPLIDAFLSEQLLVETTEAIVAHLDRCPACRAEVENVRRLRHATRGAFMASAALTPDARFLAELATSLRGEVVPVRSASRPRYRWLAVAAAVLLIAGGGFGSRRWAIAGFSALLHAASGDHQFCALTYKLAEKPITLEEAATRFDPINRALETVEMPSAPLSGGPARVVERHSCVYEDQRFAHLVVRYKGNAVSVLVARDTSPIRAWWGVGPDAHGGVEAEAPTAGFHVAAFRSAQYVVFVVSTLGQHDVDEVAQAMTASAAAAIADTN
jgi:hypothetical protein